jgi:hypothetical protein
VDGGTSASDARHLRPASLAGQDAHLTGEGRDAADGVLLAVAGMLAGLAWFGAGRRRGVDMRNGKQ